MRSQLKDQAAQSQNPNDGFVAKREVTLEINKTTAVEVYNLADKFKTPLVPNSYETWYSYVTKADKGLVSEVQRLMDRGVAFNPSEFGKLYVDYIDPSHNVSDQGDALQAELKTIMQAVNGHLESSNTHSSSLDEADKQISSATVPEDFKRIISSLLKENATFREQATDAYDKLEQSKKSMDVILTELEKTQDRALKDPLTNIGNRRYFDEMLTKTMKKAREEGHTLCLAIADLDHFKQLNDNYGHLVGDAVLKYFSSLLEECATGSQCVARYGGEEFAIIFADTDIETAHGQLEKLRKKLAASDLVTINGKKSIGTVSSSFGLAKLVESDTTHSIIERTDELLYKAKSKGRNQVCMQS
ncbi:MAG: GGDEF domain-containing protein [Nitratireductor sp.]